MSRHRNVRRMNVDDEYFGEDDICGRSVDDDSCISPSVAAEFMYVRGNKSQPFSAYMDIQNEVDEDIYRENEEMGDQRQRQDSLTEDCLQLNPTDKARLRSCLDELHNVLGETLPEHSLIEAVMRHNFNCELALNALLTEQEQPKPAATTSLPQRDKWRKRKEAQQEAKQETNQANGHMREITEGVAKLIKPSKPPVIGFEPVIPAELMVPVQQLSAETSPDKDLIIPSPRKDEAASFTPKTTRETKSSKLNADEEYRKQRAGGKELLNLVVIGHVDAGKSTLLGHLLYLVGAVSKKVIHKYEQESKKLGKSSFAFAWVLDESGEERARGVTMDVGSSRFETKTKIITVLDAPGHKDFIPNMITGAAQADVAILVVDSTRGEFETGFEAGGQTREHALLVRSLGVSQLIIAVNKLDNNEWSEDRYNEIVKKLGTFLKQAGFKESDVTYVPVSGLTGENLTEEPKQEQLRKWYRGPTILQQIDAFRAPERPVSKPLRISVIDVFKGQGQGPCIVGKVETGLVQTSDRIVVMPMGDQGVVKSILSDDQPVSIAFAGDQVMITISGLDPNNVSVGGVICEPSSPIRPTTRIQARIVIFNIDVPITKGFPVVMHFQSLSEPAVVKRLISQLHKSTGEIIKRKPRCLTKQSNAVIEIETSRPICMETYKNVRELGRFMLRSAGQTIAAGVVTEIY